MNLILAPVQVSFCVNEKNKLPPLPLHTHATLRRHLAAKTAAIDQSCSFIHFKPEDLDDLQAEKWRSASACSYHLWNVCCACHPDTWVSKKVIRQSGDIYFAYLSANITTTTTTTKTCTTEAGHVWKYVWKKNFTRQYAFAFKELSVLIQQTCQLMR